MKFLVLEKHLPGAPMLPPQQYAALLQAAQAWIKANLDNGTLDCAYSVVNNSAGIVGMAIGNADSHEALEESIMSYPLFVVMQIEAYPLSDVSRFFDGMSQMFQKMAGG